MRGIALILFLTFSAFTSSAEPSPSTWEPKHTQLANQYLQLLIAEPEYGDITELLWSLYQEHGATELLLSNVATQAAASEHPSPSLIHAHLLRQSGDPESARDIYRDLLQKHPDHPTALRSLADVSGILDQPEEHLSALRKLSKILPDDTEILVELGHAEVKAENLPAASAAWTQALQSSSNDPELSRTLARAMLTAGLTDEAIAEFSQLSESSDPATRIAALEELARIEEHLGRTDDAATTLKRGISLTHFQDWRHEKFFSSLIRLHERAQTLDALEADLLTSSNPPSEATLLPLIRFYRWTVNLDALESTLQTLVDLPGTPPAYRQELADIFLANDKDEAAATLIDSLLAESPSPELLFYRCSIDLRLGNRETAATRLRDFLVAQPSTDLSQRVLSFAQENYLSDLSHELLNTSYQARPNETETAFALASHLFTNSAQKEAIATLHQHINAAPKDSPEHLARLSEVASRLLTTDQLPEALGLAKRAAAHPAASRPEFLNLAEIHSHLGNFKAAENAYQQAWSASSDHESRTDVDERLLSLLENHGLKDTVEEVDSSPPPPPSLHSNPFDSLTTNQNTSPPPNTSPASRAFAAAQSEIATRTPTPDLHYRAAWWTLHTSDLATAYEHLSELIFDENEHRTDASVEVERLLLQLTTQDQNQALRIRQLERLTRLDPESATSYQRQLAAIDFDRGFKDRAISSLKTLTSQEPDDLHSLELLANLLYQSGRTHEITPLWKQAFDNAPPPLLPEITERYARLLIEQGDLDTATSTIVTALRRTTDPSRRKDLLQHQRNLIDLAGRSPESSPPLLSERLIPHYKELTQNSPLDSFYPSVLAELYTATDSPKEAFNAMREAHYLSPENLTTLPALRDAALTIDDHSAAIYYQRQLVFAPDSEPDLNEWKRLIKLLENSLHIDQADQIRSQLSRRFNQNKEALIELSNTYEDAEQTTEAIQIRSQLIQLQPHDLALQMRLALNYVQSGNPKPALPLFENIIAHTPSRSPDQPLFYPITDQRWDTIPKLDDLADALFDSAVLTESFADALDDALRTPHPEFQRVSNNPSLLRLNAIHHLAKLSTPEAIATLNLTDSTELLWAQDALGIAPSFPQPETPWDEFCQSLISLRSQRIPTTDKATLETSFQVLLQLYQWKPSPSLLSELAQFPSFTTTDLWRISQLCAKKKLYHEAITLGERTIAGSNHLAPVYSYYLSSYAKSLGDHEKEIMLLRAALDQPIESVRNTGRNLFYDAFLHLYRKLPSPRERSELVTQALSQSERITIPRERLMRLTYIAAVNGDTDTASQTLEEFHQHTTSRGIPGNYSITNHFASPSQRTPPLWEQLHGHANLLTRHQLSPLARHLLDTSSDFLGDQFIPNEDATYGSDALQHLQIADYLRKLTPQEQVTHILEATSALEDPFAAVELADTLGSKGNHRAKAAIYRNLLNRAPANPDYGEEYVDACLRALDHEAGLAYVAEFHASHHDRRPQSLNPDGIQEAEAIFLRLAHDLPTLKKRALTRPPTPEQLNPGRPPHEIYFLEELAILASDLNDPATELAALYRLHEWAPTDAEIRTRLAKSQLALDDPAAAVHTLTSPPTPSISDPAHSPLLAQAYAALQDWPALTSTLTTAIEEKNISGVVEIANLLLDQGRTDDARNALILASRRTTLPADNLTLLPPILRANALSDSPNAASIHPLLRRASTDSAPDPALLQSLTETLTTHRDVLKPLLKDNHPQNSLHGLVATAFLDIADAKKSLFSQPNRPYLFAAAEFLLDAGHPREALTFWDQLIKNTTSAAPLRPLHIHLHHALGDQEAIEKVFVASTHRFYPGVPFGVELPITLAKIGRTDLAAELFASYDSQLQNSLLYRPAFSKAYAEFLIETEQFHHATQLLRRDSTTLLNDLPHLLVSLYTAQDRLPELKKEIHHFHLSSGIITKTLHLANQH